MIIEGFKMLGVLIILVDFVWFKRLEIFGEDFILVFGYSVIVMIDVVIEDFFFLI